MYNMTGRKRHTLTTGAGSFAAQSNGGKRCKLQDQTPLLTCVMCAGWGSEPQQYQGEAGLVYHQNKAVLDSGPFHSLIQISNEDDTNKAMHASNWRTAWLSLQKSCQVNSIDILVFLAAHSRLDALAKSATRVVKAALLPEHRVCVCVSMCMCVCVCRCA